MDFQSKRSAAEFLAGYRRAVRLQEDMLKKVGQSFGLSLIETIILCFLHNNPDKDTAAEISEYRMLSKGNVSPAVENLLREGLLSRRQDVRDRRVYHLTLTEKASPIAVSLEAVNHELVDIMFTGITEEERIFFQRINGQIFENLLHAGVKSEKENRHE